MPVHKVDINNVSQNDATIGVWQSSTEALKINVTAQTARSFLSGSAKNDPDKIAAKMTELLQNDLDVVQLLTSLPNDDPDKTIDPARPDLFWKDLGGGIIALVGRAVTVSITWTDEEYLLHCRRT
jgi:hypothetical protein